MSWLPTKFAYNAGSAPTNIWNCKFFIGTSTTDANGLAVFQVTDNGLSGGTSLFTNISTSIIIPTARNNTSSAVAVPSASVKQILNNKTIEVNVVTGRTLLALGATQQFVGAGIVVDILIIGL